MEVNGFKIHPDLVFIIRNIEANGYKVEITDTGRTFKEHIELYKKIANRAKKEFCIDDVPLASYHLPYWGGDLLRAVDIKVLTLKGKLITGKAIHALVEKVRFNTPLGMGVGKYFMHIDTRQERKQDAIWYYNY